MTMSRIGYAEESDGVDKPNNENPIQLLPSIGKPMVGREEKSMQVDARFDCPCCENGISIKIDTKIPTTKRSEP